MISLSNITTGEQYHKHDLDFQLEANKSYKITLVSDKTVVIRFKNKFNNIEKFLSPRLRFIAGSFTYVVKPTNKGILVLENLSSEECTLSNIQIEEV